MFPWNTLSVYTTANIFIAFTLLTVIGVGSTGLCTPLQLVLSKADNLLKRACTLVAKSHNSYITHSTGENSGKSLKTDRISNSKRIVHKLLWLLTISAQPHLQLLYTRKLSLLIWSRELCTFHKLGNWDEILPMINKTHPTSTCNNKGRTPLDRVHHHQRAFNNDMYRQDRLLQLLKRNACDCPSLGYNVA